MFATLDPTLRALTLPSGRRALLSDTVGFLRKLPTTLIQAFRATLEEVREAALILHVTDASSALIEEQDQHVVKVLEELGASDKPRLRVLTRISVLASWPPAILHPTASIGAVSLVFPSRATPAAQEGANSAPPGT